MQLFLELKNDICKSDVLIKIIIFFLKKLDLSEKEFGETCLRENKSFQIIQIYILSIHLKKNNSFI